MAYAVVTCLADLAIRRGDVARLSLDDIDWRSGKIHIPTPKGGSGFELPLIKRVGEALSDYIRNARPQSKYREVFLRESRRSIRPASIGSISYLIDSLWTDAGLRDRFSGTHVLRHTAATELVRKGFSLKIIADVLGHSSMQSTVLYAKVDTELLRPVARPWPIEENCR